MKSSLFALIVAALATSTALAGTPAPEAKVARPDGNACTWFATVQDWRRLDDRNLVVWGPGNRPYHVELSMALPELGSTDDIAFIDGNGDGRLCGFGLDRIVIPGGFILASSSIVNMTRLDEAALTALGEKHHVDFIRKAADKTGPAQ